MVPSYDDLLSRRVADVMTSEFIYVDAATKLTRVLQLMVDHRMKSIPVLDARQRLVGIIAREDIMRALAGGRARVKERNREVYRRASMRAPYFC